MLIASVAGIYYILCISTVKVTTKIQKKIVYVHNTTMIGYRTFHLIKCCFLSVFTHYVKR